MTQQDKLTIGQKIFNDLCNDPDVWATHGLPCHEKEKKIVAKIDQHFADTMRENEALRFTLKTLGEAIENNGYVLKEDYNKDSGIQHVCVKTEYTGSATVGDVGKSIKHSEEK